jgi:long-chain acyl-CoA synthetase
MNIAHWLERTAKRSPTAAALYTGTRLYADYSELARRASAIARYLTVDCGVLPGDRVALFMWNCPQYLECLYGVWWAGAAAVPINSKLHEREAAAIVSDARPRAMFSGDAIGALRSAMADDTTTHCRMLDIRGSEFEAVRARTGPSVPVERELEDLAWIFYTSGTTGRSKGAMLSHGNLIAMSLAYLADVDEVSFEDGIVYAAPISHGAGLYNFVHVLRGARHIFPESGGFDPRECFALARAHRNVSFFAAPTMVRRLVDTARQTNQTGEGIKTIVYGGGPMYLADIQDALAVLGPRFVQIYGQGETPMTITALSRRAHLEDGSTDCVTRLKSVGVAHSVVRIRIVDSHGLELPVGQTGEIEVKGLTVMAGYWQNPVATAQTLTDGWLRTGDIGHLDSNGLLTLSDRSKDVIISGGANIYPREVEEVLLMHPQIREVAVIGVPDPEWGEAVCAFIVPIDNASVTDSDLDTLCLNKIARFKRPKMYVQIPGLPRNNYGKVLKALLRERIPSSAR